METVLVKSTQATDGPVEEAVQLSADNFRGVISWMGASTSAFMAPGSVAVPTRQGNVPAEFGDWIVRDAQGELSTCKQAVFATTYEEVN